MNIKQHLSSKLAYMLIGALIAMCAYIAGDMGGTHAQKKEVTTHDIIHCRELRVEESVIVGKENPDKQTDSYVMISSKDNEPSIQMYHHLDRITEEADAQVFISTHSQDSGKPRSLVYLYSKDKSIIRIQGGDKNRVIEQATGK